MITDAAGQQWQAMQIYQSMALIAIFTMGFVALLSVFLSINTNNVVYAAKIRLALSRGCAPRGIFMTSLPAPMVLGITASQPK